MAFKILTVILIVLVAGESIFILVYRHPASRFLPVATDDYGGLVALDTASGRLCKTLPKAARNGIPKQQPAQSSGALPRDDPAINDPQALATDHSENNNTVALIAMLPFCSDVQ